MMSRVFAFLAATALIVSSTATAQTAQPEWEEDAFARMELCLSGTTLDDRAGECRHIIQDACPSDAGTTNGMMDCLDAEYRFWDTKLNTSYRAAMDFLKEEDEFSDDEYVLADQLRDTQRAWIKWRDTKCDFAYNQFRGGSIGRLAGAGCLTQMTRLRAIELEDLSSRP